MIGSSHTYVAQTVEPLLLWEKNQQENSNYNKNNNNNYNNNNINGLAKNDNDEKMIKERMINDEVDEERMMNDNDEERMIKYDVATEELPLEFTLWREDVERRRGCFPFLLVLQDEDEDEP